MLLMRRFIGAAIFLTACFAFALAALRIPQPALHARLDTCDTPCWEGIQPGITTRADALERLTRFSGVQPSSAPCYDVDNLCDLYQWLRPDELAIRATMQADREIVRIVTAQSPGVTLGDALLMLRRYDLPLYEIQISYSIETLTLWLGFANASVRLSITIPCPTTYRDLLATPLSRIILQEPQPEVAHVPATLSVVRKTVFGLCEL